MQLEDPKCAQLLRSMGNNEPPKETLIICAKNVTILYYKRDLLNKANTSDKEDAFLDLHLSMSISNDIVSTKIYDKRDDFDFDIVNFPFLDGDVPHSTSNGVSIS